MSVTNSGNLLFYKQYGTGESLCLLHGFLENHRMWEPFIKQLSQRFHLIVIDLPGHGFSAFSEAGNSMHQMAEAVYKVFEALGVKSVKIAGHSMGGYVALAFAKAYPANTAGILLLNSTPEADTEERKKMRDHAIDMAGRNYTALVSMSVANLFSSKTKDVFEEEIALTKREALKVTAKAYISCQKAMRARPDHSLFWSEASFKKQMLLGSDDGLINSKSIIQKFEDFEVEIDVLPGGHMLHIENFERVSAVLGEF